MAMMTARGEASQNHAPAVEVWRGSLSWTWREPLPWVWRDALPRCGVGMARPLPWTSREPLAWVWRDARPLSQDLARTAAVGLARCAAAVGLVIVYNIIIILF